MPEMSEVEDLAARSEKPVDYTLMPAANLRISPNSIHIATEL